MTLGGLHAPRLVLWEESYQKRSHNESKGITHRLYAMLPLNYLVVCYIAVHCRYHMMHFNIIMSQQSSSPG